MAFVPPYVSPNVPNVGAPVPPESRGCPEVPAVLKAYAVPVPYATAPAVGVAFEFVPPLDMARRASELSVPLPPDVYTTPFVVRLATLTRRTCYCGSI